MTTLTTQLTALAADLGQRARELTDTARRYLTAPVRSDVDYGDDPHEDGDLLDRLGFTSPAEPPPNG